MRLVRGTVKVVCGILTVLTIFVFGAILSVDSKVTDNYKVSCNNTLKIDTYIPVELTYEGTDFKNVSNIMNVGDKYNVKVKIFGVIPVTATKIEVIDEMYVLPLGTPFGMKIYTKGVLVVDLTDVDAIDGFYNPADRAGLKIGDTIISINGKSVYSNTDVSSVIEKSNGEALKFLIEREGKNIYINVKPVKSKSTGVYKAGIWVRDSSAGIGTLTFYSPSLNTVCGLGHGVCDSDTGNLLQLNSGEILAAEIISFTKAQKGAPGELKGRMTNEKYADMKKNTSSGVYGYSVKEFNTQALLPIAVKQEIENGKAYILTTVSGSTPVFYGCEIKKIKNNNENQNLLVEITDTELLNTTGGILQGMSGSPIIQNGKLIGAVTHVLVDDPTRGYGIFAENMLETARNVTELKDAG